MSKSMRDTERAPGPVSRTRHAHKHACAQSCGERHIHAGDMRTRAAGRPWPQPRLWARAGAAGHPSVPSLREGLAVGGRRRRIGFDPARGEFDPGRGGDRGKGRVRQRRRERRNSPLAPLIEEAARRPSARVRESRGAR